MNRRLHTVANICVQSLCVVDLLFSCVGLPVTVFIYTTDIVEEGAVVDKTVFNPGWCIPSFFFSCCLQHICLLTLDRFIAITRPLSYSSSIITHRRFMISLIIVIWLVNGFFWFGPVLLYESFYKDKKRTYVHHATFAVFWLLPIVTIVVMYVGIIYEIFIKSAKCRPIRPTNGTVTIIWIVLFLLLTCLPSSVYTFILILNGGEFFGLNATTSRMISIFSSTLKLSNCIFNPLIYSLRMKSFKTTLLSRLSPKPVIKIATIQVKKPVSIFTLNVGVFNSL